MGSFSVGSVGSSGSGIDVTSIVNQLLYVERAPARFWEVQQVEYKSRTTALSDINTKLVALKDAVNALKDVSGKFNSQTATSSNTSTLTATATATAVAANHVITVTSLAATSSYYSNALTDSSTTFTTGSFTLQVGTGTPTTITVDATNNTLDGLATAINNLSLGVTASVITDANGARLSVVSSTSGAAADLTIASNTTGLTFTKGSTGTNASLTVDGAPISSATNTVSTVIPGVTLSLIAAAPASPVTLTVKPDTAKAKEAINDFVTAYNALTQAITTQFTYNTTTKTSGPLAGESALRIVQQELYTDVAYSITGNNGYVSLSTIGVNMNNDGTLTVDSTKLDGALATNFTDVKNLLQTATTGFAVNFASSLTNLTDSTNGPLNIALKGYADSQTMLADSILNFDANLETRRKALTEKFSRVDAQLRQMPLLLQQIQGQLGTIQR
ncbi:MAG: flagellar filament capping protein FliD [Acidobacteria bacterium]|nr:flagellar filament capping protein FliD [Acidobacteriota bacterium]MBI3662977.1 flagellar filament capping protein FliD [Acidobacteriota bacterium]